MVNTLYSNFGIIKLFIFFHSCIYTYIKNIVLLINNEPKANSDSSTLSLMLVSKL